MNYPRRRSRLARILVGIGVATVFTIAAPRAEEAVSFSGVAAGDASSTTATLWTRALPAGTELALEITTDPTFEDHVTHLEHACTTDPTTDFTCKRTVRHLVPGTVYYYRFVASTGETSLVGRVKTAPKASQRDPVRFAFSGDYDGLIRPYALASVLPSQNLDFYVSLGDVIYETASNLTASGAHNGEPWLNSPSVTLSGPAATLNGDPNDTAVANTCKNNTTWATLAQLTADYQKKYREQFLPVNSGGQNSLQVMFAGQGNYTTYDNHELGNRQYINGGAPAGGPIGGPTFDDMPTGCGVDARANGSGNPGNANDVNTSATDYMNRSVGFRTLQGVFLSYQPIADRGLVHARHDPRTNGSKRLYSAHQWGKNLIFINTDARSYRDLRLKTADGSADDTGLRAANPDRTYLGATQLAWLEQTLLDAERAGTRWKFVSVSDPIDQIGPLGGALALKNLPCFYSVGCNADGTPVSGPAYSPVNADGGKSYIGGYRWERNELLRFIAEHHIVNVVFIATDDHQNRINELTYSPTDPENQATYVRVPHAFSIVAGPLGATGPDLITNHTFAMAQQYANSIAAAQEAAGVEPLGLIGYPGLHDLYREEDPTAATNPQPVDFYSPDTFNFVVLDITRHGNTLTVTSIGMNSTAQNAGTEYVDGPQARPILSFSVDAAKGDADGGRGNENDADNDDNN
jgi:phosphodiesterase/alkaline phosphatase D-like protein